MNDTAKQLIEKAEGLLIKAKGMLQLEERTPWEPKNGDAYWFINSVGVTSRAVYYANCHDDLRNLMGNFFKTREDADFAVERLKVIAEMRRFAEANNEPIDWSRDGRYKYSICYDHAGENVITDWSALLQEGLIYFSGQDIAQRCIEEVGADRIKKYYLGVK